MPLRIAHVFSTWQEPREVLEPCLRSTVPYVDEVIMTEGLIEGVDDHGLGMHGDISWLAAPSDWLPEHVWISSRAPVESVAPWPNIAACQNWLLSKARELRIDWILNVEADEELHGAADLHERLASLPPGTLAVPIKRVENTGIAAACPWKLLNVQQVVRYLNGHVVQLLDGSTVDLVPPGQVETWPGPWISHHPERRPPWRRNVRLGDYENLIDPVITSGLTPLLLPANVAAVSETPDETATPAWYCPACGARFHAAGVCANDHPPYETLLDPEVALRGDNGGAGEDSGPLPLDDPALSAATDSAEEGAAPDSSPAAAPATTGNATIEVTITPITPTGDTATGTNDGSEVEAPPASEPTEETQETPADSPDTPEDGPQSEAPTEDAYPSPEPPADTPEPTVMEHVKGHLKAAYDLLATL